VSCLLSTKFSLYLKVEIESLITCLRDSNLLNKNKLQILKNNVLVNYENTPDYDWKKKIHLNVQQ
jgi:hypothetical protein